MREQGENKNVLPYFWSNEDGQTTGAMLPQLFQKRGTQPSIDALVSAQNLTDTLQRINDYKEDVLVKLKMDRTSAKDNLRLEASAIDRIQRELEEFLAKKPDLAVVALAVRKELQDHDAKKPPAEQGEALTTWAEDKKKIQAKLVTLSSLINENDTTLSATLKQFLRDHRQILSNLQAVPASDAKDKAVLLASSFATTAARNFGADQDAEKNEESCKPQWCRKQVGQFTYYCVGVGITDDYREALKVALEQNGYELGRNQQEESVVTERTTQLANLISIVKRYHFLKGSKAEAFKALSTILTLASGFDKDLDTEEGFNERNIHAFRYLPDVTESILSSTYIGSGLANITESMHGDGIDVLLEQETKDGRITTMKATWLPKLDIFVVANESGPGRAPIVSPSVQSAVDPKEKASQASGTFSLLDTIFGARHNPPSVKNDAGFFNTRLRPRNIDKSDAAAETDVVLDVVNVIVRPYRPSKDVLPASRHELIWKPTLGVFDLPHNIPTTNHELHCVIPPDYQTRCLDFARQNLDAGWIANHLLDPRLASQATIPSQYHGKIFLKIESLEFFAGVAMGPRADEAKFILDLREHRMIPYSIPTSQTNRGHTYPFNLSVSTASISVAFQSSKAGNGSTSLSKFHVPTSVSSRGAETALSRFYVNFANQNRPREENESVLSYRGHSTTGVNSSVSHKQMSTQFFMQRYQETMLNSGQMGRAGGCETFEEWLERGAFYNWVWPRDGGDLSTRFHVHVAFDNQEEGADSDEYSKFSLKLLQRGWQEKWGAQGVSNDVNILIFDMVPKAYSLSITNGKVTGAETSTVMAGDGARRMRLS